MCSATARGSYTHRHPSSRARHARSASRPTAPSPHRAPRGRRSRNPRASRAGRSRRLRRNRTLACGGEVARPAGRARPVRSCGADPHTSRPYRSAPSSVLGARTRTSFGATEPTPGSRSRGSAAARNPGRRKQSAFSSTTASPPMRARPSLIAAASSSAARGARTRRPDHRRSSRSRRSTRCRRQRLAVGALGRAPRRSECPSSGASSVLSRRMVVFTAAPVYRRGVARRALPRKLGNPFASARGHPLADGRISEQLRERQAQPFGLPRGQSTLPRPHRSPAARRRGRRAPGCPAPSPRAPPDRSPRTRSG